MEELTKEELAEEKELIKLEKNTRGYNWTLKIFAIPTPVLDNGGNPTGEKDFRITEMDIERLANLNNVMNIKFGSLI